MRAPSEDMILFLHPSCHSKSHVCGASHWRRTTCHKKCCLSSSQKSFPHLFAFVSQVYFRALLVINWVKNLNKMASVLFFCLLFGIHLSYRVVILHLTPPPHTHTAGWPSRGQRVGPILPSSVWWPRLWVNALESVSSRGTISMQAVLQLSEERLPASHYWSHFARNLHLD